MFWTYRALLLLRLNFHPVDLVPVIEAALDTVRPAAEAKDIQLEWVDGASLRSEHLQQVVWNLLSNAVKFTKGGRVLVRLELITPVFRCERYRTVCQSDFSPMSLIA